MPKARVPIKLRVQSFQAIEAKTPQGVVSIPAHWRLISMDTQQVLASGPHDTEALMLGLVKMSSRYIEQHPTEASELMGSLAHTKRKLHVLGPDGQAIEAKPQRSTVRTADGVLKPNESSLIN